MFCQTNLRTIEKHFASKRKPNDEERRRETVALFIYLMAKQSRGATRDLCQNCARKLLNWLFRAEWMGQKAINGVDSTDNTGPIPSLATKTFNVPATPSPEL